MVKIIISVDDIAPIPGYGLLMNNGPLKFLEDLNKEFGAKFTLFAIPMLDGKKENDWRNHPKWCKALKELDYVEIGQHGLTHKGIDPRLGVQEFIGIKPEDAAQRLKLGREILEQVGFKIRGFRAPGWGFQPYLIDMLKEQKYDYIADHFIGTVPINQNGIYRLPLTFTINQIYHAEYDDYIILHSHINPKDGNKNAWNKELYKVVSDYLKYLKKDGKTLEFLTYSEYLDEVTK